MTISIITLITAITLTFYFKIINGYISFLFHNINIAVNPDIISKTKNSFHQIQTNMAVSQHIFWARFWSPITILTIIQLISLSLSPLFISPNWLLTILPLFIATSITPLITFKKPDWINEWHTNNEIAYQLIQLDQITNQLILIKEQLINSIHNPHSITQADITQLHNYSKFLINLSNIITTNIKLLSNSIQTQ